MGVEDWYLHNAQQCSRNADAATDARQRAALKEEANLWRGIARDVARQSRDEARPWPRGERNLRVGDGDDASTPSHQGPRRLAARAACPSY